MKTSMFKIGSHWLNDTTSNSSLGVVSLVTSVHHHGSVHDLVVSSEESNVISELMINSASSISSQMTQVTHLPHHWWGGIVVTTSVHTVTAQVSKLMNMEPMILIGWQTLHTNTEGCEVIVIVLDYVHISRDRSGACSQELAPRPARAGVSGGGGGDHAHHETVEKTGHECDDGDWNQLVRHKIRLSGLEHLTIFRSKRMMCIVNYIYFIFLPLSWSRENIKGNDTR